MKYKALRKVDTKEFVIMEFHDNFKCLLNVYTTEIPRLQPTTATKELLTEMYDGYDLRGYDLNDFEFVEIEVIESGVLGADIRNKLSPINSVIDLYRILKNKKHEEKRAELEKLLDDAINRSAVCVKYLSNLL